MIKFWKLVTGVTNLEIRMWKYCGEACDGGYAETPLHAMIDTQNDGGGRRSSRPTRQASEACGQGLFSAKSGYLVAVLKLWNMFPSY